MEQEQTAILLFTRSAEQEAAYKQFSKQGGAAAGKKIARLLIGHAWEIACSTGLPVFLAGPEQQIGATFGEKLSYAFSLVYAEGYRNVICIGNDCPGLSAEDLLRTDQLMRAGELVIGPATDGGVYLIGMPLQAFDPVSFISINWQTTEVADELRLYALQWQVRCNSLAVRSDIDSAEDLVRVIFALPEKHSLRDKIFRLLFRENLHDYVLFRQRLYSLDAVENLLLRAPPLFA